MRTPHKIYHPAAEIESADTHGQGWKGESVQETIDLCRSRMIEPVLRRILPKHGRILEAGCGLGTWVFYLRELGYTISGIELSDEALKAARDFDPRAPIEKQDITAMNFPDRHFDSVLCFGLLEHFEEGPQRAFAEIRRVLTESGLLFVTVPIQNLNRRLLANPLKSLKRRRNQKRGIRYAFEEYRYTTSQFTELLREAGFEILEYGPDEFLPPKCIGLYVDYPFLHHQQIKWQLNAAGTLLRRAADLFSPWLTSGGAYWICRKS